MSVLPPSPQPTQSRAASSRAAWLASALLAAAIAIAYANSLGGPFVFDDIGTITDNPTIRQFSRETLAGPPGGTTASGRPLVNLSFAFNFALGGLNPTGYHVFNLGLHIAAALTLFGLARRLLTASPFSGRLASQAVPIAFSIAVLWALHPLQTAAVTYTVQRAEAMAALFHLVTLYAFVRSQSSLRPWLWLLGSVAACLCGMASKETMVSAPLVVLLFDRGFFVATFAEALRRRRGYYAALACTWLLLAWLVIGTANRGGSIGSEAAITPWTYLLTQCGAIVHYLRLVIWPSPLVFDYGTAVVTSPAAVWLQALLLMALFTSSFIGLVRRHPLGLAGVCFFALLAPSSSVVPIVTQTIAEHRMYLPLAAVLAPLVVLAWHRFGRRTLWAVAAAAVVCGSLTWSRNNDYRDATVLWRDTVAKNPASKRAHNNLATVLFSSGDIRGAIAEYQSAVDLDPSYATGRLNLARLQLQAGDLDGAAPNFAKVLEAQPDNGDAHAGLAFILSATGRLADALAHYREAVRLCPTAPDFRVKLAQTLFRLGDLPAAIEQFRAALQLAPANTDARTGLGTACAASGLLDDAKRELTEALRLNPNDADAHFSLGNVFVEQGHLAEAIPHYEKVLQLRPDHEPARRNLALAREYLAR